MISGPDGSSGVRGALRWLDMPPLWLLLFLALAWLQASRFPGLTYDTPMGDFIGGLLVGGGILVMALAFWEFSRAKTSVVPHREPTALITSGIFRYSRNPIYLADAMFLAGFSLGWGAYPALLVLVPLFVWLITDRFIHAEEARLRQAFGAQFEAWRRAVRRWI